MGRLGYPSGVSRWGTPKMGYLQDCCRGRSARFPCPSSCHRCIPDVQVGPSRPSAKQVLPMTAVSQVLGYLAAGPWLPGHAAPPAELREQRFINVVKHASTHTPDGAARLG